uniref:Immunoglobulin V-set domain-containing protein n=1 Tax=Pelusios castaneus TaxID=367368 RepID=A0A8C8S065_9SAUR
MGKSMVKSSCFAEEDLEMVRIVQGGTFSTECSYTTHKYSQREKFWCKQLSDLECHIILSSPATGMNYINTNPNTRISLKDSGTGWISVSMTKLRLEDSGIYWCGSHLQGSTILLKMITLNVLGETQTPSRVHEFCTFIWHSEANFNGLYMMAGLLGIKFLTALLIFIFASNERSKATGQEIPSWNKHQFLPLTGNFSKCIHDGMDPAWQNSVFVASF